MQDQVVYVADSAEDGAESLARLIRHLKPANLLDGKYVTGEPLLHAWTRTLILNVFLDRMPEHLAPEYARWEQIVLDILGEKEDGKALFELARASRLIQAPLTDKRFFSTAQGYFGFGPQAVRPSDSICILLGLPTPLVLRPGLDGTYQVVGWAYVHGLMDSEAFLGPLPEGWYVVQLESDMRVLPMYGMIHKTGLQAEDPRLGEPLVGWKRISRRFTADDPVVVDYFKNVDSGEIINHDPRMTVDALRTREVLLKPMVLA